MPRKRDTTRAGEAAVFKDIESRFRRIAPAVDYCSLRFVCERDESLRVRQDVPQPIVLSEDVGAMITIIHDGGIGYGATGDLTTSGLKWAADRASAWAKRTVGRCVMDFRQFAPLNPSGEYIGPEETPWDSLSLEAKFDLLRAQSRRLKINERIVDWEASLLHTAAETLLLTAGGGRCYQKFSYMSPSLYATANEKAETQTRTLGSGLRGACMQGGLEVLEKVKFHTEAERIAEEAVELLSAENCPAGTMDVVLAPDQMILQIHESIGHPLEMDRILGDERNFAGTSFVTQEMFGSYRYGSQLLNVTFDPTHGEQFASFGYDDEGLAAKKANIIEKGILMRPLGAGVSQARSGLEGVANSRACSWNRPPIDRIANLNLEPGDRSFDDLIAAVEKGVYMETNRSWSIDDSRNKFQFGCERARLIRDGKLGEVLKNPNYRGISATFWRNLKAVGDESTFAMLGTPSCGKGEPNQTIRVGHASPACLFTDVDVFGGVS